LAGDSAAELLTAVDKPAEETLLSVGDSVEERSAVGLLTEFADPVESPVELLVQIGD
jgi:hypothetical protein